MSDSTYPQIAEVTGLLAQANALLARLLTKHASAPPRAALPAAPLAPPTAAPQPPPAPAFLTTAEAAERLRMSKKGLEQLRARGKGPRFVRIGNAVRYPAEALLEYGKEPLQ